MRKIIHIDMDAFYASVEQRDNKKIRGKAVAVGGDPDKRGVVSTASYEARAFGIHSAMSMKKAKTLCPNLIIIHPNMQKYKKVSKELMEIYKEYTDVIEPLSLDEAYLDVSVNKKGIVYATDIAKEIKRQIKERTKLTASAGVAENKLLAKIASDINKPEGLFVVKPSKKDLFIKELNVSKLWGVGKVTLKKLNEMGVKTCKDLQEYPLYELEKRFGKLGKTLYFFSRGIDERSVSVERKAKSSGSESTFRKDSLDRKEIEKALEKHSKRAFSSLEKHSIKAKTVSIKIKYNDFTIITRSTSFLSPKSSYKEIAAAVMELFKKIKIEKPVRLIGVSYQNLSKEKIKDTPNLPFT